MPIRFTLLILLVTFSSLANSLPLAEAESCDVDEPECKELANANPAVTVTSTMEVVPEVVSNTVFDLVTIRFVATDLSKLLDKKTTALLNAASYSIGMGKNTLGDFNSRRYLVGRSNNNFYGITPGSGMGATGNTNGAWRSWVAPEKNRKPDRYEDVKDPSKAEEKEKKTASWMSKSASVAEYAAVVMLGFGFWVWLRQSRTYSR